MPHPQTTAQFEHDKNKAYLQQHVIDPLILWFSLRTEFYFKACVWVELEFSAMAHTNETNCTASEKQIKALF